MYLIDESLYAGDCRPDTWLLYDPNENTLVRLNTSAANAMAHSAKSGQPPKDPDLLPLWQRSSAQVATKPYQLTPFQPTLVSLFLTNQCQLRCIYCYASAGQRQPLVMPWEIAKAGIDCVIQNAVEKKSKMVSVVFHGGGEATLEWRLLEAAVQYGSSQAQAAGLEVQFSGGTNAMLSRDQCTWLASHFNTLTISLDGPPEIQNRHRPTAAGKASSSVVESTLQVLSELKMCFLIRATVTSESAPQLVAFMHYLARFSGVRKVQLQPMFSLGRGQILNQLMPEPGLFIGNFLRAKSAGVNLGIQVSMAGTGESGMITDGQYCGAVGGANFSITPDGRLSACYEVAASEDVNADLFIYGKYDAAAKNFVIDEERRRGLAELRGTNREACQNCFCLPTCAGGCPNKIMPETSYAEMPSNPGCEIIRALTVHYLQQCLEKPKEKEIIQ
jgi:uncharacterized protein